MLLLPFLTALVAGFLHALEPDHMAAVTTFVSRRPDPLRALAFGVQWGVGHSLAVMAAGAVLVLLDLHPPAAATSGLEFGVGVMLFGLGVWLLWGILHRTAHEHAPGDHEHPHSHDHSRATLWVGMAHGLAGTAPLIAVLPVALVSSRLLALAYLLLFGAGTVAGMGLYAALAGVAFSAAGHHSPALGRVLRVATAVASATLGVFWMAASVG